MNKGLFIPAILMMVFLVSACTEKSETTEFYLVRHAEKAEWTNPDTTVMYNPELSEEGLARAQNFRELMADKEVDIIFSTEYKRNMGTIQPLAEYGDIEVKIYHWYEWQDMLDEIEQKHRGETIVICGHGDNLLPMISALNGIPPQDSLVDGEYDKIFHLLQSPDTTITETIIF